MLESSSITISREEEQNVITHDLVGKLATNYPDSQAGKMHTKRHAEGRSYEGLQMDSQPYESLKGYSPEITEENLNIILGIYQKIAKVWSNPQSVSSRLLKIMISQYQSKQIQNIAENQREFSSMLGARVGADVLGPQIVEINLSCPGGPVGFAEIMELMYKDVAELQSEIRIQKYLKQLDEFYTAYCETFEIDQVPSDQRKIVIVPKYTFSTDISVGYESLNTLLQTLGRPETEVIPAEAIIVDAETNQNYYLKDGQRVYIDQAIIHHHYQAYEQGVTHGVEHKTLVPEASAFTKITAGNRAFIAFLWKIVEENPSSKRLRSELGIEAGEIDAIRLALPKTAFWSSSVIRELGINSTNLESDLLENEGKWIKLTSGSGYGGRGVEQIPKHKKRLKRVLECIKYATFQKLQNFPGLLSEVSHRLDLEKLDEDLRKLMAVNGSRNVVLPETLQSLLVENFVPISEDIDHPREYANALQSLVDAIYTYYKTLVLRNKLTGYISTLTSTDLVEDYRGELLPSKVIKFISEKMPGMELNTIITSEFLERCIDSNTGVDRADVINQLVDSIIAVLGDSCLAAYPIPKELSPQILKRIMYEIACHTTLPLIIQSPIDTEGVESEIRLSGVINGNGIDDIIHIPNRWTEDTKVFGYLPTNS